MLRNGLPTVPVRSRWSRGSSIGLALLLGCCAALLYLGSYAPMYKWQVRKQNTAYPGGAWRRTYVPVEWLIDETCLRGPLLGWANIVGVRQSLVTESYYRRAGFWKD